MRAPATLALMLALCMGGCVNLPTPTYQPGIDNTSALLATPSSGIGVGEFTAAESVDNRHVVMRGNTMSGAGDSTGTYSGFLRAAIEAELRTAGRFDASSPIVISGELLRNDVDAASMSVGKARVDALFVVTRSGAVVYNRTLSAEHAWESSFFGAIAVPAAMQNYVATVQKLVGRLFSDPDFRKAIAKQQ